MEASLGLLGGAGLQELLKCQVGGRGEDGGMGCERCLVAQPMGGALVAGER